MRTESSAQQEQNADTGAQMAGPPSPRDLVTKITDVLIDSFGKDCVEAKAFIFESDDDYEVFVDLLESSSARNWDKLFDKEKNDYFPMPFKAATDQATKHGQACAVWANRRRRANVPLARILKELKSIKTMCPVIDRGGFKTFGLVCEI